MTSRTLKSLHVLRTSHLERENAKGSVTGDNLVTATPAALLHPQPESQERPWQATSSLWASVPASGKWEGKFLLPTRLEAQSVALTTAQNNLAQKPSLPPKSLAQPRLSPQTRLPAPHLFPKRQTHTLAGQRSLSTTGHRKELGLGRQFCKRNPSSGGSGCPGSRKQRPTGPQWGRGSPVSGHADLGVTPKQHSNVSTHPSLPSTESTAPAPPSGMEHSN